MGLRRALYFYAGFSANAGIVPALVGADDAIFSDRLNHACLIDGARLSSAKIHRYPHNDLAALERLRLEQVSAAGAEADPVPPASEPTGLPVQPPLQLPMDQEPKP